MTNTFKLKKGLGRGLSSLIGDSGSSWPIREIDKLGQRAMAPTTLTQRAGTPLHLSRRIGVTFTAIPPVCAVSKQRRSVVSWWVRQV